MSNKLTKRKPGRPRATDTTQTMDLILRTAASLFMKHGYENVSLSSVAETCEVTKASVYYYFHNKSELFTRCIVFVMSVAHGQTLRMLSGEGTLRERLKQVAVGRMHSSHAEFETMMREAAPHLTDGQLHDIRTSERALYELLIGHVRKGIEDGELRQCDPLLVAHLFTSAMVIRNREEVMQHFADTAQLAEHIVDTLFQGIRRQ